MKIIVGIAWGGFSSEHDISKESGATVFNTLKNSSYELYKIHITKESWLVTDLEENCFTLNKDDFSFIKDEEHITFSVIVNMIHGAPGENGQLAALLELLNIPHTSCSSYVAALTYNKRDCLSVARSHKIRTAKYYTLNQGDSFSVKEIEKVVGFPCFVKANRAGSSFGVYKVYALEELSKAIEKAFKEDSELLIESALNGREVSVGVIRWKGEIMVLPITEIISENDFFDYEAKYNGKSQEVTPAQIPKKWEQKINRLSKEIYQTMKLDGVVRSEFIIENDIPHLLEINTVPGMTPQSIIPQQLKSAGISLKEYFEELIEQAVIKKTYL